MPTAVERALERFFDEFLKRNITPNEGLGGAFRGIDGDLTRLEGANADNFVKIERDPGLKHDFTAIGDAFVTVGNDFQGAAIGGELINGLIGLLFGGGGAGIQADLGSADQKLGATSTGLKILGHDFLNLDSSPNLGTFEARLHSLADGSVRLGDEMAADRDAFMTLSADVMKLTGDPNALLPAVQLGDDLKTIGNDFSTLATDFANLGHALAGGGGGAGDVAAAGTSAHGGGGGSGKPVGDVLMTLFHDFHTLGADTGVVVHDTAVLISDLIQPSLGPNANHANGQGNH